MKLIFKYLDTNISFENNFINCIYVENKHYFCRIVNDLVLTQNKNITNQIFLFDNNCEINMSGNISVYIDLFNIDFNSKKILTHIYDLIEKDIDDVTRDKINSLNKKFSSLFTNLFYNYDLPFSIDSECDLKKLMKNLNLLIVSKETLFENLLLLIDIEVIFKFNKFLVFVNLEDYLTKTELEEFLKYCNSYEIKILLINNEVSLLTFDFVKYLNICDDLTEIII